MRRNESPIRRVRIPHSRKSHQGKSCSPAVTDIIVTSGSAISVSPLENKQTGYIKYPFYSPHGHQKKSPGLIRCTKNRRVLLPAHPFGHQPSRRTLGFFSPLTPSGFTVIKTPRLRHTAPANPHAAACLKVQPDQQAFYRSEHIQRSGKNNRLPSRTGEKKCWIQKRRVFSEV